MVEMQGGYRGLFKLLRVGAPSLASHGVLVDAIIRLAKQFQIISFTSINASCNRVAQALATKALSSASEQV